MNPESFVIKIKNGDEAGEVGYLTLEPNGAISQTKEISTQLVRFINVVAAKKFLKKHNLLKNNHRVLPYSPLVQEMETEDKGDNARLMILKDNEKVGYIHFDPTNTSYACKNQIRGCCFWKNKKEANQFAKIFQNSLFDGLKVKVEVPKKQTFIEEKKVGIVDKIKLALRWN